MACVEQALLRIDDAQHRGEQRDERGRNQQVVRHPEVQPQRERRRQQRLDPHADLLGGARVFLAAVVAARFERAAQRADRRAVGRAVRHVFRLEGVVADRAAHHLAGRPALQVGARQVVAALRLPGQQRRDDQRGQQGDEGRERLGPAPQKPGVRHHRHRRRDHHRHQANRVDVVQVRPLELDRLRAPAQRLVDDQVGHQRTDPRDGDVAVEAQHLLQRGEHAQRHQEQGDQHVEHQPHHAPGVAVREPREEVRPGQRAGIGVGQVDLHLRHHDEQRRDAQHPGRVAEDVGEAGQVHAGRLDRVRGRDLVLQREEGEEGAAQHLQHARHDPSRPRHQYGGPPLGAVGGGLLGQEAQVVDLLADLHHQREGHRGARAEHQRVEVVGAGDAADQPREVGIGLRVLPQDRNERQHEEREPDRLRPQLQRRDHRDAAHHQRDDDDRRHQVAHGQRPVEVHLQREREDGRLQREEDEGEARVDERGEGGAQVAEAGTAREQVHVDAVLRGVVADRQAGEEGDDAHHQDGPQRVLEAVAQRDGAADGLQRQEGRGAERRVRHPELRPLAEAPRRVAQRVVLQRLVRHPGVVVAADTKDLLTGDGRHVPFSLEEGVPVSLQEALLVRSGRRNGPPVSPCGEARALR